MFPRLQQRARVSMMLGGWWWHMDILASVNSAIALVSKLKEIAKKADQAEMRNLLADLSNELADAKMAIAEFKERIAILSEENRLLRETQSRTREKPSEVKFGCYKFEGEDGLFCTACYDTKGQKILASRLLGHYVCPVCKANLS
ncbi:MAG: hypothetical protein AB1778_01500 [Candidatus Bipolaricaulota bacterium]